VIGKASEYDKVNALCQEGLLGYVQDVCAECWDKFAKSNPQNPEKVLIQKNRAGEKRHA